MKHLIFLIFSSLIFSNCSLTDSETVGVAYLVINEVDLTTNADQGLPVHQIEDVWVYANEQPLGIFTLPARIPVLLEEGVDGPITIRINAGVKPNGSKNESLLYPFYNAIRFDYDFTIGEEYVYKPVFKVTDNAKFDIIDGFENGTVFNQDLDGNTETLIIRSSLDNNGGNFSGLVELASDKKIAEFTTQAAFLSTNNAGGATFLEFDYKSDTDVAVGYIVNTGNQTFQDFVAIFVPQDEWIRVYIDFTAFLTNNDVESYKIKFYTEHFAGGTSQVFFDNVKLVHF